MPAKPSKKGAAIAPENFDLATTDLAGLTAAIKKAGGQRSLARLLGVPRTTVQKRLYKLRENPWKHRPPPVAVQVGDKRRSIQRFILSSAQDNSAVHEPFLKNLEAYAEWLRQSGSCEIMIGGYTYSKKLFTDHDPGHSWFNPLVRPYLVNDRMRLAGIVDFCGEMNTLPTAEKPLSGFETYTRERWGVFPHPKVQLVSVPTMKHEPTKLIMTTGSVTKSNYLPKKAGIKASFHHIYGAVLVEIGSDGAFFCRHLLGEDDTGAFYDLDRRVDKGVVTEGHRIEVMTPGDIHTHQIDPVASKALFGIAPGEYAPNGKRPWTAFPHSKFPNMLDALKPKHLMAHDILDFRRRNHHSINDPDDRFFLWVNGMEDVEEELREVAMFSTCLTQFREWLQMKVVDSNHDQALAKWLKTADADADHVNAILILRGKLETKLAIKRGDKSFSIFETMMQSYFPEWPCKDVTFLREDKGHRIGGIEHSNHGHRGLNGARGSTAAYTKIGPRVTIGHQHTCAIMDGVYVAGTTSLLELGYNKGPSSWSHTTVVQYANGKRALVTLSNGLWKL